MPVLNAFEWLFHVVLLLVVCDKNTVPDFYRNSYAEKNGDITQSWSSSLVFPPNYNKTLCMIVSD